MSSTNSWTLVMWISIPFWRRKVQQQEKTKKTNKFWDFKQEFTMTSRLGWFKHREWLKQNKGSPQEKDETFCTFLFSFFLHTQGFLAYKSSASRHIRSNIFIFLWKKQKKNYIKMSFNKSESEKAAKKKK